MMPCAAPASTQAGAAHHSAAMTWTLDQREQTTLGPVRWGHAGDGPPLVLAHGWPWSSYAWHRVIPALAEWFHVYWYDMPGFGQSAKALDQPTGLDVQGCIFGEMLDHWGLARPSVWAHDFGGAVSLRAQLLQGRTYERYILMNVVAMRPWGSAFFDHVRGHVDAFLGLPPHIHRAVVIAYIAGALVTPLPADDLDALAAPWLDADGQVAFYRQFAQADEALTAVLEPSLASVSRPVHVLWGADDPWIPLERGQALAEAIGTTLEPLTGLGHLPQLEDPNRVVARALDFLTDQTGPTHV